MNNFQAYFIFIYFVLAYGEIVRNNGNSKVGNIFSPCKYNAPYDTYLEIDCVHPDNKFPIRNDASFDKNKKINYLTISGQNFSTIPDKIFSNLKIENLILSDNNLKEINSNSFEGILNTVSLLIRKNHLKKIHKGTFKPLENLQMLAFMSCGIDDQFLNHYISELKDIKELYYLSFESNQLTNFKTSWSQFIRNVHILDLNNNKLNSISHHSFSFLSNLQELKLKNNLIKFISPSAFLNNGKLNVLELSNNYLSQIPNLLFLNDLWYLFLSNQNGKLKTIHKHAFQRRKSNCNRIEFTVDLSNNHITKIQPFAFRSNARGSVSYIYKMILSESDLNLLNNDTIINEIKPAFPPTKPMNIVFKADNDKLNERSNEEFKRLMERFKKNGLNLNGTLLGA